MKKIKKLKIRPGQILDALQQQNVMAAGDGEWAGACTCQRVHNSHLETKIETISNPDVANALIGSAEFAAGCFFAYCGATLGGLSWGTSSAMVMSGIGMAVDGADRAVSGACRTSKVLYKREMELTNVNPWTHNQKSITSSLI